ncbi:MAG TPA: (deoxy)nucleoside triphosphate pyrophosphohydrolase [Allosphingosinicella sp.]
MTVVAAALVDASGRILLQKRSAHRQMAGLWEFPGGKVEDGERPEQALVRELEEELGIFCDPSHLSPVTFASADVGPRHLLLLLYVCREWRGTPEPRDAEALQWLQPRDMSGIEMPPADKPLIPILEALI